MSLITELSEFIGPSIVAREVEFKDKKHTFHFRELRADEAEGLFLGVDPDPKKNKGLRNRILATILANEDGTAACTAKEAGELPNELANLLQAAAFDVNGLSPKAEDDAKKE